MRTRKTRTRTRKRRTRMSRRKRRTRMRRRKRRTRMRTRKRRTRRRTRSFNSGGGEFSCSLLFSFFFFTYTTDVVGLVRDVCRVTLDIAPVIRSHCPLS